MSKKLKENSLDNQPFHKSKFCKNLFLLSIFIAPITILGTVFLLSTPEKLTPVIVISDGPIQGSIGYSRDGFEFWQFLGIPYAKPPTGTRKFTPPEPNDSWKEIKQATSYPGDCAQFDTLVSIRPKGSLDCLYLNVFVNMAHGDLNSSKPVLVYIHGGAFLSNAAYFYHPQYLMDHNVVLVVLNYRLGPFGFLNLQDAENGPQGNMGLLDQNMALKWVQRNIASFGGDPKRVTLFGESAGGISTHLQVLSSQSKGLFQRAIMMSGSALAPWAFLKHPRKLAYNYARKLHCNNETSRDILQCFDSMDWSELVGFPEYLFNPTMANEIYRPSVDGAFLTDTPENIFRKGDFPDIPVMFGINGGEGVIRSAGFDTMPELIDVADKNWAEVVGNILLLETMPSTEVALKIREKYFGNMCFTENPEAFKRNVTNLFSDVGFFFGAHKSAMYHAKKGAQVYMYLYNYSSHVFPGTFDLFKAVKQDGWLPGEFRLAWSVILDILRGSLFPGWGSRYGVGHAEDMYQVWNILGITKWFVKADLKFSKSFVQAIVDFANETTPLAFRNTIWPSINQGIASGKGISYMLMDNQEKGTVILDPFLERLKFWESLSDELN